MTKIRLTAHGGLPPLRQKTSDTHGESPASSEKKLAPAAFSLNQSRAVCLPLVTDSQKLIWVTSDQVNLQLGATAKLDQAFDRFPYLTHKQTAELAQRCSLHPDQVKMWFMVQRLRYGISWDYEDICKLKWKFKSSQGTEEPQNGMRKSIEEDGRKKEPQKRAGKESAGNKAGEDRELEEGKRKKRKKMTYKIGTKRRKRQEEGVVERAGGGEIINDVGERELQASTQTETTLFPRKKPAQQSFAAHDEKLHPPLTDVQSTLLGEVHVFPSSNPNVSSFGVNPETDTRHEGGLGAEVANFHGAITDVGRMKEVTMTINSAAAEAPTHPDEKLQGSLKMEALALPTSIPLQTKTRAQLALLKKAFAYCQYPDSDEYDFLELLTGVSHCTLVQWFADMRYYVKKGKPGWLTQEQHSQALSNIRYQQFLKALAAKGRGQKAALERGKSCSDGKSVSEHSEK